MPYLPWVFGSQMIDGQMRVSGYLGFDNFDVHWIGDPGVQPPPKTVLFYLHGGGFTMGKRQYSLQ
jgi:acetyl esterase/lipase